MEPITFPTTEQIAAALETLLDAAQRTYDHSDRSDKEERAFWRRQRNAYINAQADFLSGRHPLQSGDAYLVPSASRAGSYHRCWKAGGVWLCSCEAGEQGVFHRHTALISAIEYAIELIEQGLIGEDDSGDSGPIVVTTSDSGVQLTRGDLEIDCRTPEDVAMAVRSLVSRICEARAEKQIEIAPPPTRRPHWYGPARDQQARESLARARSEALALQERAAARRAREMA